jgi:hypothetical protein
MMLSFSNLAAQDSRFFLGSARPSRAIAGALAGNSAWANESIILVFSSGTSATARRDVCAPQSRPNILL